MAKNVLTYNLSEPLNGATTVKVDINAGDGNLTIDRLAGDEQALASGTLQYFKNQGLPTRTLVSSNGQVTLTLSRGGTGRSWFRFPWVACNGATEWQIHLNPAVLSDITAHSDGGNVKLNLPIKLNRILSLIIVNSQSQELIGSDHNYTVGTMQQAGFITDLDVAIACCQIAETASDICSK